MMMMIGNGTGRVGYSRTNRDHPKHSILKFDQNAEKSPGDMRRLVVT